jgi:hypothetical protein
MTSINNCLIGKISNEYFFNFIGNENDINDESMFKIFDINYINLNYLPINYYPIYNGDKLNDIKNNIKNNIVNNDLLYNYVIKELDKNIEYINNEGLIYNNFMITPLIIIILFIWIFIFLYILKYIHFHYNIYYIYFMITIIITILIFGSLWFLYVNSQLI